MFKSLKKILKTPLFLLSLLSFEQGNSFSFNSHNLLGQNENKNLVLKIKNPNMERIAKDLQKAFITKALQDAINNILAQPVKVKNISNPKMEIQSCRNSCNFFLDQQREVELMNEVRRRQEEMRQREELERLEEEALERLEEMEKQNREELRQIQLKNQELEKEEEIKRQREEMLKKEIEKEKELIKEQQELIKEKQKLIKEQQEKNAEIDRLIEEMEKYQKEKYQKMCQKLDKMEENEELTAIINVFNFFFENNILKFLETTQEQIKEFFKRCKKEKKEYKETIEFLKQKIQEDMQKEEKIEESTKEKEKIEQDIKQKQEKIAQVPEILIAGIENLVSFEKTIDILKIVQESDLKEIEKTGKIIIKMNKQKIIKENIAEIIENLKRVKEATIEEQEEPIRKAKEETKKFIKNIAEKTQEIMETTKEKMEKLIQNFQKRIQDNKDLEEIEMKLESEDEISGDEMKEENLSIEKQPSEEKKDQEEDFQ